MATTTIGKSIVIEGEISGEDDLLLQGSVTGNVSTKGDLHVEGSSVVHGDLEGASVVISGQVTGNVVALQRLELTAEGRLVGDVRTSRIIILDGASFRGKVEMDL